MIGRAAELVCEASVNMVGNSVSGAWRPLGIRRTNRTKPIVKCLR